MSALDINELAKRYPTIDREKLCEAFELLKKLIESGVPLNGENAGGVRRSTLQPLPKHDPRTIKLRARL